MFLNQSIAKDILKSIISKFSMILIFLVIVLSMYYLKNYDDIVSYHQFKKIALNKEQDTIKDKEVEINILEKKNTKNKIICVVAFENKGNRKTTVKYGLGYTVVRNIPTRKITLKSNEKIVKTIVCKKMNAPLSTATLIIIIDDKLYEKQIDVAPLIR